MDVAYHGLFNKRSYHQLGFKNIFGEGLLIIFSGFILFDISYKEKNQKKKSLLIFNRRAIAQLGLIPRRLRRNIKEIPTQYLVPLGRGYLF